jgi:hypothetical protein
MMSYTLRKGYNPDYKDLDKTFANRIVLLDLDQKVRDILWIRLRQLLHQFIPDYTPAYTSIPLRYNYQGRLLLSTCPVIAEYKGKILPLFFRTVHPMYYRHDLHLNYCMASLAEQYPTIGKRAHVLCLTPEFNVVDRYLFGIEDINHKLVLEKLGKLMVVADSGPFNPIDRCDRNPKSITPCQFWEQCSFV